MLRDSKCDPVKEQRFSRVGCAILEEEEEEEDDFRAGSHGQTQEV